MLFFKNGDKFQGKVDEATQTLTGIGSFQFQNGQQYIGSILNGKLHGMGELKINEHKYNGEWFQGQPMTTKQWQILSDNQVYIGQIDQNYKKSGTGQLVFYNHRITEQQCSEIVLLLTKLGNQLEYNSLKNNNVVFIYKGQWKNDHFHGEGQLSQKESEYWGEFQDNMYHGNGKLSVSSVHSQDKYSYEGQFMCNVKCGYGKLTINDTNYIGEFLNDKKSGKGRLSFSNGDYLEGIWQNDELQGYGELQQYFTKSQLRISYNGNFADNIPEGEGSLKVNCVNGIGFEYQGQFKDGKFNGSGVLAFENGIKCAGEFLQNEANGHGDITFQYGDRLRCYFVKNRKNGICHYQKDSTMYEGQFQNDLENKDLTRYSTI